MSVVDSSGWIEFLIGSENGRRFQPEITRGALVVPTIVVLEVRRWLLSTRRLGDAEEVTRMMMGRRVVPLTAEIAVAAADIGVRHKLPLADSIVYATAQSLGLDVWTQDRDFEGLPDVQYVPKETT